MIIFSILTLSFAASLQLGVSWINVQLKINSPKTYKISTSSQTSQRTSLACTFDYVTLVCDNNQTISLQSAFYGSFATECVEGCCAESADDCRESLQEEFPVDWSELLSACQDKTWCQVENLGRAMASCPGGTTPTDYVTVTYTCSGGEANNLHDI